MFMVCNTTLFPDAKMLVICMSVSWVVLEWYLSHDFIVGNRNLSSCKSAYYVLYKCCFLLFSQVTYQYTFVIYLIVRWLMTIWLVFEPLLPLAYQNDLYNWLSVFCIIHLQSDCVIAGWIFFIQLLTHTVI